MTKVIVTGAAGFIASHVCDALLERGFEVHIIDDLSAGRRENVASNARLHELDIRDAAVHELFERHRFDVMVHHAAQMDVRRSVADPKFDADVNVLGFLNLMEAGRKTGLQKVVFASTGGAIYGEPEYTPQDEHHPLQPLSPYGITKLVTEKYLFFYEQSYGIKYVSLRYANIYGPRQSPHGEAGVVAIFSQRLLSGNPCFINGDGEQTRDYVFVGDVVRANVAAMEYPDSGIINIGTGVETTVNELFRHIREFAGSDAEERHVEAKPGEQRRSVLSYEKAKEVLGWEPRVDVREGLRRTVEWFSRQARQQSAEEPVERWRSV